MKAFIKNFQFIVLLLLVCLPSKADDTNKVTVGLTIDSTAVVAESQSFGRRIEGVVIHSELDYMLLKFRETTKSGKWLQFKGEIGAYSIKDSKLLWTYPFDYRNSSAYCTKAGVGVAKGNKFTMLDPNTGSVRWQGKFTPVQFDDSTKDFHFGLINPAYHYCMEHTVMSGKSVYCLKYMFLTSLLRNEKELADKYLELISFVPFERSFVKKYRPMLFDNSLVNSDYLLSTVYSMIPASDAYEEEFPIPLYIWYHKYLNNFYSRRTFENSMAVALYTKDLDDFTKLARIMPDEPTVPAAFEDALVVEAMRKNDMKFLQQIPEYAVSSTKQMLNEAASLRGKSTKEKGIALKDKYTGKYTFYYFYQNLKDEESYRVNNTINSINSQVN